MIQATIGKGFTKIAVCGSVQELTAGVFELVNRIYNTLRDSDAEGADQFKTVMTMLYEDGLLFATVEELHRRKEEDETPEHLFNRLKDLLTKKDR